jgi:hypothetical protein
MTTVARCVILVTAAPFLCTLVGCGNGLAQVSGVVMLDGQPIKGGREGSRVTVQFQPVSGNGSTAIGIADETGRYTLGTGSQTGIPAGDYFVTVTGSELVPSPDPSMPPSGRRITDPKFADAKTSGMRFTVAPGKNQYDIAVTSPAGGVARKAK